MDWIAAAEQLVANLDQRMSPSAYDTAWLARLRSGDGAPRWPEHLAWLLERQHPDGSWGAGIRFYHHDRVVCTLMALIALSEQAPTSEIRTGISRGERYIWRHTHLLHRDPASHELVGFELLFPTLMAEAGAKGLNVPRHSYGIGTVKRQKLELLPPEMLYSKNLTTVHSLEFLGSKVDAGALHEAVFDNGSLGNSPAATAFYIHSCREQGVPHAPEAEAYLGRIQRRGAVPAVTLYPFRTFEQLWVLNNFALVDGSFAAQYLAPDRFLDQLEIEIECGGVGLDSEFGIPDADCTSVACFLLSLAGRAVNPAALLRFEEPGGEYFRTYFFERNPSVSTNIHALEALRRMPAYPSRDRLIDRITTMLFERRRFDLYWTDKWHASPYYATGHALVTLLNGDGRARHACRDTLAWLVNTQRDDGSWGYFDRGTAEETAYALLALQHAYRRRLIQDDVLRKGAGYLLENGGLHDPAAVYEPLWLGKCLYAPHDIIRSAILAVLIQHEGLFGRFS